jgi:chromosome segregation ATPase
MSSDEAAEAVAEDLNLSIRLADLEQKYVDLELDRNLWFTKAKASDERVVSLQEEKETFQSVILKLKEELSISNAELQKERSSKHELEASATNTQERASRIEAEADDLREEIRYVTFIRLFVFRIMKQQCLTNWCFQSLNRDQ